ncbi:MAG: aldehyde dehydrogenase family protein, partial [Bacteroidales bacterium]|nr:aldehyde dehydrogenase family protein [Bacteroidales bacterium]
RKLHDLLLTNERILADAIYQDFKKSFYLTVENELSLPYGEINRAIRKLKKWSGSRFFRTNLVNFPASSRTIPVPYGVSLVIGPWNYPYMLALVPVISSMAAGNTVILKPSEVSFHASKALADLINANFPSELFYVQEGGVDETTELLQHKFDKIFFTGSSQVGRIVMKAAAEHLTPVTLELGGKNPVIVMPDCRLKKTARRLTWGKYHNNGTACVSPDHVYVHEDIKDQLIKEVRKNIVSIYGEDPRQSPALPRMINEKHFDRVMSLIEGGNVVAGGNGDRKDLYIEPTVLDGVEPGDAVMQDEVFGPVMPLLTYNNLDELLGRLKKQPAPLVLYIFTGNVRKARKIVKEIPSGGGMINDTVLLFINMNTPFGGLGESGMGSYHGKAGFEAFSHYKTILNKPTWFDLYLKYPPYRKFNLRIIRSILG